MGSVAPCIAGAVALSKSDRPPIRASAAVDIKFVLARISAFESLAGGFWLGHHAKDVNPMGFQILFALAKCDQPEGGYKKRR